MKAPGGIDLENKRRKRMRSIVLACALGLLVIMFYLMTIIRLGGDLAKRAL